MLGRSLNMEEEDEEDVEAGGGGGSVRVEPVQEKSCRN